MWGGWYNDPLLIEELTEMKKIYDGEIEKCGATVSPEVVFFADETGFSELLPDSPQIKSVSATRTNMGIVGAPYDSVMVEDAHAVIHKYKAAVFPMPIPSAAGLRAMELCREKGIPFISSTEEHCILSSEEIRYFIKKSGVHIYTDESDVVYAGNGYVALHSKVGGKKAIRLPKAYTITPVFGADIQKQTAELLEFMLKENGTALFRLDEI